ncbi:unnamed protein product [Umbelopsis ramanniana]
MTNHGDTALHLAIESNHSIIVASLINHHANIEAENEEGNTPIHLALLNGHVDIVDQLKLAGARVEKIGNIIAEMLYQASLAGQVDRIGKTLDIYDNDYDRMLHLNTTLHRAVQEGQTDAVTIMLISGADIDSLDEDGLSPLFLAGQYPEVISTMIHHGACIHVKNKNDRHQSVLHHYASQGQIEGLILLLNCDSDIHTVDKDNKTVLHYAAEIGDYDVAAMLLQRGVDINTKNVRGETALHCATRCGYHEIIDMLIQWGVDINTMNDNYENALHTAVENNMIEIAGILIDNGIDIDARNYKTESTALHLAIEAKNSKQITFLVKRHADINAINRNNETALHIAAKENLVEECALLIMHGANIDAQGIFNRTPLYYAVESCNSDLVSLLLNHGASVYERDSYGSLMAHTISIFTRLTGYDSERQFISVIKMLIEAGADTTGIEEMPELLERFPTLRDAVSKSSNRHLDKKLASLNISAKNENAHKESLNEVDITLTEYGDSSSAKSEVLKFPSEFMWIASKGSIGSTRQLSRTTHKYGSGFPSFKRLQLDKYSNTEDKDVESITSGTAPFAQLFKSFKTISIEDRGEAIIRSLLDCVGISFFVSEHFFMLESKQCVDMMSPKWASHFDKMNGIIREPGLLIVQIPPKNTSLSISTWYKSTNPYLRFIDAVCVCRNSCPRLHLSQEAFSSTLGGSERKLAAELRAVLIAGLSILSIAGGNGLVERLVTAILGAKLEPIQNALQSTNVIIDWQVRSRCRCPCDAKSVHRPLSPIAAAKAVGIGIWRQRHSHNVNRVWDLEQDILVKNIDVRNVVFITHRWKDSEISCQDVIDKKDLKSHSICRMSPKLFRIRETLRNRTKYVWIDTICIDKSNLSELDEAIRSMYKWYASCAAVVLDSSTSLDEWHSRGWCLQEGAAAGVLYGISNSGNLATVHELANEQHQDLCTLDLHLYYRPGNAVEILARMDVRKTTREEDMAYALAGIFSIDLTLAYGEGLRSRTRLLHQLAIQKGDLSFLSFHTTQLAPHSYLPIIDSINYLVATCARASAPVTVSHFGICFEVQLVKGETARQLLVKLKHWIEMSFSRDRYLGAEELIKAGEQPENQRLSSVELAIVHDIRSLILVQVYGQDMQTGGGKPIKLCYRLQCCQIEESEFARLFTANVDEPKEFTVGSEELKREAESKANVAIEHISENNVHFERIWLGDKSDSAELNPFESDSVGRRRRRR